VPGGLVVEVAPAIPLTPLLVFGARLASWHQAADASTFTEDANGVAEWRDKSGNGHHVSQALDARKPNRVAIVGVMGGSSAVLFDRTNKEALIGSSAPVVAAEFHVFAVVHRLSSGGADQTAMALSDISASDQWLWMQLTNAGGQLLWHAYDGVSALALSSGMANDATKLLEGRETSSTDRGSRIDNGTEGTTSTNINPSGIDTLAIGAMATAAFGAPPNNVGREFDGYISEVVIVDGAISVAERDWLIGWLGNSVGESWV
jgi:hypothetical protein